VTDSFLSELGAKRPLASELQQLTNGKNFRGAASDFAKAYGRTVDPHSMEDWMSKERQVVTAHLSTVLRPDPKVAQALAHLSDKLLVAVVTSSALSRLDACLEVTALSDLFAFTRRFSAEDSLARPTIKPDPAVYNWASRPLDNMQVRDSRSRTP
jgi:beta-phosphoglucomutase-like phosphatase (HAD superfamily)